MDLQPVKEQIRQLEATVQKLEQSQTQAQNKSSFGDDEPSSAELQGNLLKDIRDLDIAARGPLKHLNNMTLDLMKLVVVAVALKTGIAHCLAKADGYSTDAESIAKQCGIDKNLTIRTLRFLSSNLGIGSETGPGSYTSNELARLLDTPDRRASFAFSMAITMPTVGAFPKFLEEVGSSKLGQEPTPFSHAFGGTLWQVLDRDASIKQTFDNYFAIRSKSTYYSSWDVYPAGWIFEDKTTDVKMVDVGGGRGQYLVDLLKKFPQSKEHRFVLQDLPSTIEAIKPGSLPANVQLQSYDFFTGPNPVQGAAIYFMHDILHDHDDEKAVMILKHTARAMSPTSRVFIAEWVLRDVNAQQTGVTTDWFMMLLTSGGMERSLGQWTKLLDQAGLEVVKVYNPQEEAQSVIEARLS